MFQPNIALPFTLKVFPVDLSVNILKALPSSNRAKCLAHLSLIDLSHCTVNNYKSIQSYKLRNKNH